MPNFFHRSLNSAIADNIITNFMFKYRSRTVKLLMEHLRKVNTVLWILLWKLYDIKKTMKKLVTKYKYYQDISKKVNVNWSFVGRLFLAHLISFLCLNTPLTIVCATGKLVSKVDRHQKSEQIILSVSSITPLNKYWNEVLTSSKSIKLINTWLYFSNSHDAN